MRLILRSSPPKSGSIKRHSFRLRKGNRLADFVGEPVFFCKSLERFCKNALDLILPLLYIIDW